MPEITTNDIDKMMAFLAAVTDVCKEANKEYTFPCPICGGLATAKKDNCNGHTHASCPTCGTRMME